MANTILIKKSAYDSTTAPSGTGGSAQLAYGELGWLNNDGSAGKLFIGGKDDANSGFIADIQQNILNAAPTATSHVSAPTLGKAGFLSENFSVTSGKVKIKDGGVILGTETTGNYVATAVAGTAISVSGATGNVTVTNTGVTSAVAGAGIDVSGATGAVTVSIGTGEVVNAMIGDDEVAGEHYAAGSVDATALGTGSVVTAKVGANQITTAKLSQANGSEAVTTACIRALNVTSAELATDSVINAKIVNAAVTSAKIAPNTIVAGDIANATITGTQIESGVTLAGDVTIAGALSVSGTTTTINSANLTVVDKNIICASDQSGDPLTVTAVNGAGLTVGTNGSAPKITWDNLDSTDYWNVSHSLKFTAKSATIDCGSY